MLTLNSFVVLRDDRCLFLPLNVNVQKSGLYQLLGSNGQGKTTLLRALAGVYTNYQGVLDWSPSQRPIYIGHVAGVHEHLTLEENAQQLFRLYNVSLEYFDQIILDLGLMGLETVPIGRLSAGQARKVALMPLFHPHIQGSWLLDEPFTSLDQQTCQLLERHIKMYLDGGGLVIFTSHQGLGLASLKARVISLQLLAVNAQDSL